MTSVPIAVIDDDKEMLRVLARYLRKHEYEVETYSDPRAAVAAFREQTYGVVITDVQMPGMSGLEVMEQVKILLPGAIVIMITGFGSVKTAVDAMKHGAFDYINKPFDFDELLIIVEKSVKQYRLEREVTELRNTVRSRYGFANIIGKSAAMGRVYQMIQRIADTRSNVLIEGASGTGKELIARAIHHTGTRRDGPFVAINCGALPEALLESELFGHERGAYTGAVSRERGLFVSADTGTIFLDEIADMPLAMQAKLLRVLEDWEIRPVGGSSARKINVRVIAASKTHLAELVEGGAFREDLFYRLNVVTISLPALRERPDDIPLLLNHFLDQFARQNGKPIPVLTPSALSALIAYPWPGNIRELEHVVERAVIFHKEEEIALEDLPANVVRFQAEHPEGGEGGGRNRTLHEVEKDHIIHVLAAVQWRRSIAAEVLGINRRTLYRKIREYRIHPDQDDTSSVSP